VLWHAGIYYWITYDHTANGATARVADATRIGDHGAIGDCGRVDYVAAVCNRATVGNGAAVGNSTRGGQDTRIGDKTACGVNDDTCSTQGNRAAAYKGARVGYAAAVDDAETAGNGAS